MDLKAILISVFGFGTVTVFIIIYTLRHYSQIKIFFGDFLKVIGFLGKWFRKASVSSELEGTLNGVVNDFNKNFQSPILPNCKIQWVTTENIQNTLVENQAIICLSFDKRDHDLNFYNATYNFIQTAMVSKAKPFIKAPTRKALDLLSTKIILKLYRREVLRTFNAKFSEVEPEAKEIFHRLEETDTNGLFANFLLPEFQHLGELLFEKTPSKIIEREIDNFVNWFYELATREFDEKTNLNFETPNIKIGVILVAKLSTYEKYGVAAYTKWAEKYASEHYNAVYLLSKGVQRHKIAKEVSDILTNSKGFEQVNKNSLIKINTADGTSLLVTCICLRPDPATIRYNAWEFLKKKFSGQEKVIGIIETVTRDYIIVNVAGISCLIAKTDLSAAVITDATKLFREERELELEIIACDAVNGILSLSNVGTQTDPKALIDANLSNDKPITATVISVQKDRDQLEKGIKVRCQNPVLDVFIPRSKATFSRFIDMSTKFKPTDEVEIILEEFSFDFGNYVGHIYEMKNPWEGDFVKRLQNDEMVKVVIKEIQEKYITCEIAEGLECRLFVKEISWDASACKTDVFNIDQELEVKIISIDIDYKKISVSIRQLRTSPTREYYDAHQNEIISGVITSIDDANGINFRSNEKSAQGFVHWSELAWAKIYPIANNFFVGDTILVKIVSYKDEYDSIQYSCKRCLTHQFDEFNTGFNDRDYVNGKIIKHYSQIVIVEVTYDELVVQAYIHKSKISNCSYIIREDLPNYLPIGSVFSFVVENIDDKFSVIELSRKTYLSEIREVELGESYQVQLVKKYQSRTSFYSNDLEGYIEGMMISFTPGQSAEVIPITTDSNEFELAN